MTEDLVFRLRKRAEIRRQIATRKSVAEGQPDRIADLLEEAALEIERLKKCEAKFAALEAAGVDNWEGYLPAMEKLNG